MACSGFLEVFVQSIFNIFVSHGSIDFSSKIGSAFAEPLRLNSSLLYTGKCLTYSLTAHNSKLCLGEAWFLFVSSSRLESLLHCADG